MFLVSTVQHWFTNALKRIAKTPKLHFLDPGLLATVRGVTFDRVKADRGHLRLRDNLVKPTDLDIYHWTDRTPEQFMEHLRLNGYADDRYLIYGYFTRSQDLYMLDAMVFAIWRLICMLDERWLPIREPDAPTFTNREVPRPSAKILRPPFHADGRSGRGS